MSLAKSHRDLDVYNLSFSTAMNIFEVSKEFPRKEQYSLTDQIRRSSRSVSANIAEAFRKRRYIKSFISKLTDSEGEAAEVQVWLEFALECGYINKEYYDKINAEYGKILSKIVSMILSADRWCKDIS